MERIVAGVRAQGCDIELVAPQPGSFGDSPELSEALIALVIAGKKTASTGTLEGWAAAGAKLPNPGEHEIPLSWDSRPLCILETTQLEVIPFCDVTAEFAAMEGEGDLSLEWWRAAHERYFRREGERLGYDFRVDMPVVCQRFKVVWIAPD